MSENPKNDPNPDRWGVGNKAEAKAFDKVKVGDEEVELIFGEFPHSRCDRDTYARWPNGGAVVGFSGHRPLTSISVEECNYRKTGSICGDEVRGSCRVRISFNGKLAYSFGMRDASNALIRAHQVLLILMEHSVALWDRDMSMSTANQLIGRRIFYRDQPAVVTSYDPDSGRVGIRSAVPGTNFRKPCWWDDDEDGDCEYAGESVSEDFLCHGIFWHRDKKVEGEVDVPSADATPAEPKCVAWPKKSLACTFTVCSECEVRDECRVYGLVLAERERCAKIVGRTPSRDDDAAEKMRDAIEKGVPAPEASP